MKARSTKKRIPRRPLRQTGKLLQVVDELRENCPWDRKQTHRSLVRYLIEEAYEVADAIQGGDPQELREELGDLLLQVALHSRIASEKKKGFTFEDVCQGIAEKMIRRHPHVYGEKKAGSAAEVKLNWDKQKSIEKRDRFLLDGTPRSMPALQVAQRYGEKAAGVGFDWDSADRVFDKLDEEIEELRRSLRRRKLNAKEVELELGDVLFTVANLSRHLGVDAEGALKASSQKFYDRLAAVSRITQAKGKHLADCSPQELEDAWNQAKKELDR